MEERYCFRRRFIINHENDTSTSSFTIELLLSNSCKYKFEVQAICFHLVELYPYVRCCAVELTSCVRRNAISILMLTFRFESCFINKIKVNCDFGREALFGATLRIICFWQFCQHHVVIVSQLLQFIWRWFCVAITIF